jgi:hypothetical protein
MQNARNDGPTLGWIKQSLQDWRWAQSGKAGSGKQKTGAGMRDETTEQKQKTESRK